jgi:hypothetical protein
MGSSTMDTCVGGRCQPAYLSCGLRFLDIRASRAKDAAADMLLLAAYTYECRLSWSARGCQT